MNKALEELGYSKDEIEVFEFGVRVKFDSDYGYYAINLGYEEICAIKEEMERLQNEQSR